MMNSIGRWFRPLCPLILAGWLIASPVASVSVQAQPPPAPATVGGEEEKSEGRSLDGYLLMCMLASLAFLVVGKSARR
jgi:hypothetical protein